MNFKKVKVLKKKNLTNDSVSLLLDTSGLDFTPGQYITLNVNLNGDDLHRSYSISSKDRGISFFLYFHMFQLMALL